jgi:LysM repeat protein
VLFTNLIQRQGKELNLNQRFNSKFSQRNSKTTNNPTAKYTQKTHAVLPKETIYGIAKQYDVSVAELYKVNPTLENQG